MKSLLIFFAALSSLAGQTSLPTPSETLLWDLQDRAQASGAVWTTAQFETWPGAVYTLQSSSDLETWQPLQSFYALSNQLDLGLFEKEPAPPSNDPSPPLPPFPSNEPIPNASFFLRPSADGTFTTVSFPSPVDGVLVYQTLPAPLVAEWGSQPFYMDEHSGHFLFVAALHGSPAVNFQVTTLLTEEEPYFDALANNFAQIQALVVSNAATAAANPIVPPPPNPHAKRFYRLERSFPDSDYDGIPDWIEFLTAGMDAFNPDSDGDGSDDGIDSDLDTDGDGLNNSEEALFGTNPLKPDSDGDGILDPQDAAPVFVSITRQAAYDYEDYLPEDNPIKNLTTSANWPTAAATSETLSALISYHQLAGTLASKQSFPATFPAGVLDKKFQAGGTAETLPPPPGFCYHVEKLTHRQIIALAPSAVPYERKLPYLIVTKRTINGEVQTPAVTPGSSPLIIPATEKKSQTVELAPSFLNSGENSEESTENYNETVTATLLPVEIKVRKPSQGTWVTVHELKVAKWEEAWSDVTGFRSDFIDTFQGEEVDRFRVRINTQELPEEYRKIYVSSTGQSAAEYNDNSTEITLKLDENAYGPSDGFVTDQMILVADTVDNKFNNDNAPQDQTHIVALGSDVEFRIKEPTGDIIATLPVREKVEVDVTVKLLWEGGDGPSLEVLENIDADIKVAREIYAQNGIKLNFTVEAHRVDITGVDLSDGLRLDGPSNAGQLALEGEALLNEYSTPDNADVIGLYVDGSILSGTLTGEPEGIAIWDNNEVRPHSRLPSVYWADGVSQKYKGTFLVKGTRDSKATFSHELGHVLSLLHVSDEKIPENRDAPRNVLFQGPGYFENYQNDNKRFREFQENRM